MNHEETIQIIDVRQPGELPIITSNRVQSIPLELLEQHAGNLVSGKPTLLVCASGTRSIIAAQILAEKFGFTEVRSLVGGATVLNANLKEEMP